MFAALYKKRLKRDLERWSGRGWVSPEGRKAILHELEGAGGASRLPAIIAVLGALLLAAGAMTFVSANWQEMSKLARLGILFGAMWAAFGAAVWFQRTGHDYLLEAMLFLAAGMFGVNIMLIAQIYHIDGHYPDALFLWTVGALAVALALESKASLALAFVLMVIWAGAEVFQFDTRLHWPFLPVWAVGTGLVFRQKWRAGLHLAVLSFGFWLFITAIEIGDMAELPDYQAFAVLSLVFLALFLWTLCCEGLRSRMMNFEPVLMRYAMLAFLVAAYLLHAELYKTGPAGLPATIAISIALLLVLSGLMAVLRRNRFLTIDTVVVALVALWLAVLSFVPKELIQWGHALAYLGFAVWLMAFAQRWSYRVLLPMALGAFGLEVLNIYEKTLGSLLSTSLFFLLGGVLLIGLAVGLEALRRRLSHAPKPEHGEGLS